MRKLLVLIFLLGSGFAGWGQPLLVSALAKGDREQVLAILDTLPSVTAYDSGRLLAKALVAGDMEVAGLLLGRGALLGSLQGDTSLATCDRCREWVTHYMGLGEDMAAAVRRGKGKAVAGCLAAGWPIDGMLPKVDATALGSACREGNSKLVSWLLRRGAHPRAEPWAQRPLVVEAAAGNCMACLDSLVASGANASEYALRMALREALVGPDPRLVGRLLDLGADANHPQSPKGWTYLVALGAKRTAHVQVLLDHGVKKGNIRQLGAACGALGDKDLCLGTMRQLEVDFEQEWMAPPENFGSNMGLYLSHSLSLSIAAYGSVELLAYLVDSTQPNSLNLDMHPSLLEAAAYMGNLKNMKYLLGKGVKDHALAGALCYAASGSQTEALEFLLGQKDAKFGTGDLDLALPYSVRGECLACAEMLLEAGARPRRANLQLGWRRTALQDSVLLYLLKWESPEDHFLNMLHSGDVAGLRKAVAKDDSLDRWVEPGVSLLSWTVQNGSVQALEVLLDAGADPNWDLGYQMGAMSAAAFLAENGCAKLRLLVKAGGKVDGGRAAGPGNYLQSPLANAVRGQRLENVQCLLALGASPQPMAGNWQYGPMMAAVQVGNLDIFKALQARGGDPYADVPDSMLFAVPLACFRHEAVLEEVLKLRRLEGVAGMGEAVAAGIGMLSADGLALLLEHGLRAQDILVPNLLNSLRVDQYGAEKVEVLLGHGADFRGIYSQLQSIWTVSWKGPDSLWRQWVDRYDLQLPQEEALPTASLMLELVRRGDTTELNEWVARGGRVDGGPEGEWDPLSMAATHADAGKGLACVVWQLNHGGSLQHRDKMGRSLLHLALAAGNPALVATLVDRGLEPGWAEQEGGALVGCYSPLLGMRMEVGPSDLAGFWEWLGRSGADLRGRDAGGGSLVLAASNACDTMTLTFAVDRLGMSLCDTLKDGSGPLESCLASYRSTVVSGLYWEQLQMEGPTAWWVGSLDAHKYEDWSRAQVEETALWLLRHGVGMLERDLEYSDVVLAYYSRGYMRFVEACVQGGFPVERRWDGSGSLYEHAVKKNDLELVRLMISKGLDPRKAVLAGWMGELSTEMRALLGR